MLSFITDLFPTVYADEKHEEAPVEEEAAPAPAAEEEEEPEDDKPEIEEGKYIFWMSSIKFCPSRPGKTLAAANFVSSVAVIPDCSLGWTASGLRRDLDPLIGFREAQKRRNLTRQD